MLEYCFGKLGLWLFLEAAHELKCGHVFGGGPEVGKHGQMDARCLAGQVNAGQGQSWINVG